MVMTQRETSSGDDGGLSKAKAKVSAQEMKLAGMHEDDPQKRHEQRVLSSMRQNVATIETNNVLSADARPLPDRRVKRNN